MRLIKILLLRLRDSAVYICRGKGRSHNPTPNADVGNKHVGGDKHVGGEDKHVGGDKHVVYLAMIESFLCWLWQFSFLGLSKVGVFFYVRVYVS